MSRATPVLRNASVEPSARGTSRTLDDDTQRVTVLISHPIRHHEYECGLELYAIDLMEPKAERAFEDHLRAADLLASLRPSTSSRRWSAASGCCAPAPGRIGTQVALEAMAFGSAAIGPGSYLVQSPSSDGELVCMDNLPVRSQVVVLCTSLKARSRCLMDRARIRTMRRVSTLINVAQGGFIEEPALGDALVSVHLAATARDGRSSEPPDRYDDPLAGLSNGIPTQHLAAPSQVSHSDLHTFAARSVLEPPVAGARFAAIRIHPTSTKESA